jgi:uncharacterized protein
MNYLFFIVHPSKFHVFKNTFYLLKNKGHNVDICITKKDVLEDLFINENLPYFNIFPEGRKISWLPKKIGAAINLMKTIIRLQKYIKQKKYNYDLFITDDLLVVNGRLCKIPSLLFQDDDITAVPESSLLMFFAKYIISPACSQMGKYNYKKIPFWGFKELGSLHPNHFKPDYEIIRKFNPDRQDYFVLRLVMLKSVHDTGKKGLNDVDVHRIINLLESYGRVFISSERKLPESLEKYRIKIKANDMPHVLYYAKFLISDSQTMSAEAGVLGTPYIRYNDFVGKISYLEELESNYKLGIGIPTNEKDRLFMTISELVSIKNLKEIYNIRRKQMMSEKIDLTAFLVWLLDNYPESAKSVIMDPSIQKEFII